MAASQKIESNIIADIRAQLTAKSVTNHFIDSELRTGAAITFPANSVGSVNLAPSFINGLGGHVGFYRVDMDVDSMTYLDDDNDGDAVRAQAKAVRDALNIDCIIADLNALSSFNTYLNFIIGSSFEDIEGKLRHIVQSITMHMRPSN